MDIPMYQFSAESRLDLSNFVNLAEKLKDNNPFCDLEAYKRAALLFHLDKLKNELNTLQNSNIIEIDDDQSVSIEKSNNVDLEHLETVSSHTLPTLQTTSVDDVIFAIKENLETQQLLTIPVLEKLNDLSYRNLEMIFNLLMGELSLKEVQNFWESLQAANQVNEQLTESYVAFLFLKKIKTEYIDHIQNIFNTLSKNHSMIMKHHLMKELMSADSEQENRISLQYVLNSGEEFKASLFGEYLLTSDKLLPKHIPLVQSLLCNEIEHDHLHKLIKLMSASAAEFSNDKSYGKLLFSVVGLLDGDVICVERPLRHILGTHRSIWKRKVEVAVVGRFNDSLTQSFA